MRSWRLNKLFVKPWRIWLMADIAELMRGALEAFRPPEKLTLSEWADRYAFLSAASSAEAGRGHTLPY